MTRSLTVLLLGVTLLASCARSVRVSGPAPATRSAMLPLLPIPAAVNSVPGPGFEITPSTTIRVASGDARLPRIGRFLADLIGLAAGPEPPRVESLGDAPAAAAIELRIGEVTEPGEEAYELTVSADRVTITGRSAAGVFNGVQTFRQLLPAFVEHEAVRADKSRPVRAPAVHIVDSPRFTWRGAMLDVARHFLTLDDVKRYVDLMALHKLNRLHLHLADDQGWRIEIKSWPNLTTHGGSTEVGGGPGGYFSQQQYAALAVYAADRGITIVPEIDMPGHTNAALASYAELNCDGKTPALYTGIEVGFSALCVDKDITYRFIDDVVREIAAMTPGPYFHVGGDEVKTLSPVQYVRFIERVQQIVQSHGKQMIGWDEISPAALLPTTIVQQWRPKTSPAQAVARGAKVILSPADRTYLDMKYDAGTPIGLNWAAFIDVDRSYEWDPAAAVPGVPESAVLGVEAPLWTETAASMGDVELLAFPRLAALAEVSWSRPARRAWSDFRMRLGAQAPRWAALGINYYRSPKIPWDLSAGSGQ
jgi:hexosaminidase